MVAKNENGKQVLLLILHATLRYHEGVQYLAVAACLQCERN